MALHIIQSESIRRKLGLVIRTTAPAVSVPVYILHCKLKRRLKQLVAQYMDTENEREEMLFRITTRCDKAHKDKELFLVFLDQHEDHAALFSQTPASLFFEFQAWKKNYMQLAQAA